MYSTRATRLAVMLLLSAGVLLVAATAWGDAFDDESGWVRTDVLTFDTTFTDAKNSSNSAHVEHEDYASTAAENEANGRYSATTTGPGQEYRRVEIFWQLFDPDKVENSARKASMRQSNQVGIGVSTQSTTYSGSTTTFYSPTTSSATGVDNCSAKTLVKANSSGDIAKGTWHVKCHDLDDLGLSLPQRVRDNIAELIRKDVVDVDKGQVNIKGKRDFGAAP